MSQSLASLSTASQETADRVLAKNGRTFHWAKHFLGKDAGLKAAQLYQYCRLLDDIADGDTFNSEKIIEDLTYAITDDSAPAPDFWRSFMRFADHNMIDRNIIADMMLGFARDQEHVEVNTTSELLLYAYQVAGTVGLMMLPLLNCRDRRAIPFAVDLGIAMQLTNIARDIEEDAKMNRRYLPASFCQGLGTRLIRRAALVPTHHHILQQASKNLLQLADTYYQSAYRGLAYLPLRAHIAIAIAGHCYQAIGWKIAWLGYKPWLGRAVLGWPGKLVASLVSLTSLRFRLAARPLHDRALHGPLKGKTHAALNA